MSTTAPFQNPDIVLVHYLNVPYPDDNKMAVIAPSLALWGDKKEWTKEELVSQLKPMCKEIAQKEREWRDINRFIRTNPFACFTLSPSQSLCMEIVFSEDEPETTNDIEISVR